MIKVALFTRAWIEINIKRARINKGYTSPSSRGRGLKLISAQKDRASVTVALFTRAWIEMPEINILLKFSFGRPLHEGVD